MKKLVVPGLIMAIIALCVTVTKKRNEKKVYGGNEDGKAKTY